ncbi:MAG: arginine repressor [Eubacterium sp.]|nr:arginine repressor [Eubacterium sp.]
MRKRRQERILHIIAEREVETQDELVKILNEEGFEVTQATVSRDIRALELTKVPGVNVRQKYYYGEPVEKSSSNVGRQYQSVLMDGIISMEQAGNLLVIKTVSGMAMAVAAAVDEMEIEGIVGSIAGDDTILCAIKLENQVGSVIRYIQEKIDLMSSMK